MQFFFKTREQARKATFGVFVDNGPKAENNKRWARDVSYVKPANIYEARKIVKGG